MTGNVFMDEIVGQQDLFGGPSSGSLGRYLLDRTTPSDNAASDDRPHVERPSDDVDAADAFRRSPLR